MHQLHFDWKYSYRYSPSGGAPAPLVPIRLSLGEYQVDFLALLDTGAEQTLLDGVHLRAAGIDIFSGNERRFQGFLGAGTVAYEHPSTLTIENLEVHLPIAYSSFPIGRQVMGRDLMAHFGIALREQVMEFWLTPEHN